MLTHRISSAKNLDRFFIGALIILGFVVYGNALNGQFIWDDLALVRDNVYIRNWSNTAKIFSGDMGAGASIQYNFYRPLAIFSYMINYSIWGLNVAGYHLTNIILHVLIAICILRLTNIIFYNKFTAMLAAMLFTVHPLNTEAVVYISDRADLLSALFMLTGLIFYIKYIDSQRLRYYVAALLSYIAGVLSKENALVLPVLFLLYHYSFKRKIRLRLFIPMLCFVCVYVLLRLTVLKSLLSDALYANAILERIPGFFVAITNYIRLLLFPVNLHMEYGDKTFSFAEPKAVFGLAITLILLWYAFKKKNSQRHLTFSIGWFFIALLPVTSIYPINAFYMAEHWLYFPSIGFFIIFADKIHSAYMIKKLRMLIVALTVCLLAVYSHLTIRQNSYWDDPITFYTRTIKHTPDSPTIHNNLGIVYQDEGDFENAIASYKKTIELNPKSSGAYINLARIYAELGKNEEAITFLKKAVEMNPGSASFYYFRLAEFFARKGDINRAVLLYNKAIEANPGFVEPYNNLAMLYTGIGKVEDAITLIKKAIDIHPGHRYAYYYNLGFIYEISNNYKDAMESYAQAIEANPRLIPAYDSLIKLYRAAGRKEEIVSLYRKAIAENLDYFDAYYNIASLYYSAGNNGGAINLYSKAIKLNPKSALAYAGLGSAYCAIGRNRKAIGSFLKAISIDPNLAVAYNNLAVAYYYEKKYDLAIKYCDRAMRLGYKAQPQFLELLTRYRE